MKKSNLLAIGLAGAFLLTSGVTAFAAEGIVNDGKEHQTKTTVTIIDGGQDGKDDFDPENPDANKLALVQTPDKYEFKTALKGDGKYEVKSGDITGSFKVFNDFTKRKWEVRATANNLGKDGETFEVDSFKIGGVETAKTGAGSTVVKNGDLDKTNTGTLERLVDSIAIKFTDGGHSLQTGDTIEGTVTYQLYYAGSVE